MVPAETNLDQVSGQILREGFADLCSNSHPPALLESTFGLPLTDSPSARVLLKLLHVLFSHTFSTLAVALQPLLGCLQLLEARRLIVMNPVFVKEDTVKQAHGVQTAVVHLRRFAPRLSDEQIFKVTQR